MWEGNYSVEYGDDSDDHEGSHCRTTVELITLKWAVSLWLTIIGGHDTDKKLYPSPSGI